MTDLEFTFIVLAILVMIGMYTDVCVHECAWDHLEEDKPDA